MKILNRIITTLLLAVACVANTSTPVPPFPPTAVNFTGTTATIVASNSTTGAVKMYGLLLTVSGATTLSISDTCSSTFGSFSLTGAGSSISYPLRDNGANPYYSTCLGGGLVVNSSNSVTITGTAWTYAQ